MQTEKSQRLRIQTELALGVAKVYISADRNMLLDLHNDYRAHTRLSMLYNTNIYCV